MSDSATEFDVLVLGFGKAGKTIAMARAKAGDRVALVEKSPDMYGGTCINVGCVPTKTLLTDAHLHAATRTAAADGVGDEGSDADALSAAQDRRDTLIGKLNAVNKKLADDAGVTVIDGDAEFVGPSTVRVTGGPDELTLTAATIIINTGSTPVRPDLPGVDHPRILDSTQVQHVPSHPGRLVIVGGGPIGLEFATMFAQFGTEVTVLDHSEIFLKRFDRDIAERVREDLGNLGITIISGAKVTGFAGGDANADDLVTVAFSGGDEGGGQGGSGGENHELLADYVLLAAGRRPATDGLGLDAAGITTTERGAVAVDEHLRTNVEGVYAAGDVNGGPQFTYVSFDDHRVITSAVWGDGSRTTSGRIIPSSTFITPPLSQVGMSEDDARADTAERGHTLDVRVKNIADIPIMPRPKILGEPEGIAKFLLDVEADRILGCTLYCVDSQELINLVTVAMTNQIPASALGQGIYTHPSSSEVFNALLA